MLSYLSYYANMIWTFSESAENMDAPQIKPVENKLSIAPVTNFYVSQEVLDEKIKSLKKIIPSQVSDQKEQSLTILDVIKSYNKNNLIKIPNKSLTIQNVQNDTGKRIDEFLEKNKQKKQLEDKMNKIKNDPILSQIYKHSQCEEDNDW